MQKIDLEKVRQIKPKTAKILIEKQFNREIAGMRLSLRGQFDVRSRASLS